MGHQPHSSENDQVSLDTWPQQALLPENVATVEKGYEVYVSTATQLQDNYMSYLLLRTTDGKELIGLIDTGANCCLISESAAKRNSLDILGTTKIKLKGGLPDDSQPDPSKPRHFATHVDIDTANFRNYGLPANVRLRNVSAAKRPAAKCPGADTEPIQQLQQNNGKTIDMIIGTDLLWPMLSEATFHSLNKQKTLIRTQIGDFLIPTTIGTIEESEKNDQEVEVYYTEDWHEYICFVTQEQELKEEAAQLTIAAEKLWTLNVLGFQNPDTIAEETSQADEMIAELKRTAIWKEGKIFVKLPFNGSFWLTFKHVSGFTTMAAKTLNLSKKRRECWNFGSSKKTFSTEQLPTAHHSTTAACRTVLAKGGDKNGGRREHFDELVFELFAICAEHQKAEGTPHRDKKSSPLRRTL
uniref:Uncharacterized protein n=1 Tax=Caenorhabditis japonica TaxID=281687 RepID=A0A8R1IUH0_CAEJA